MKVKLAEKQEEKEKDQEELGLSKESADKENIYSIELPISACQPFNAKKNWYCKISLNAGKSR